MNKLFITNWFEAKLLLDMILSNEIFVVTTSVDAYAFLLNHHRANKIEFIDTKQKDCQLSEISITADSLARLLDLQTAKMIGSTLGGHPATNWEYWDKLYFIASNLALSKSMEGLAYDFGGCNLLLPFSRGPQDYYYKGRISSEIIESNLIRCGANVIRMETDRLPPIPSAPWKGSFTIPNARNDCEKIKLVHLPTCWHNRNELQEIYSGDDIYDVQSPYHNVTINEKNQVIIDPNKTIRTPDIHVKQLEIQYHGLLSLFQASEAAVEEQALYWVERHKFQLRALMFFEEMRVSRNASLLALAEHDGGLSGPISYAFRSQRSTVTFHEHSKFVIGPIPTYFPTRLSKYLEPQRELKELGERCIARIPNISRLNRKIDRPKRVAILFTDFDFPGGAPMESLSNLKSYIHHVIEKFQAEGFEVISRPRPGSPLENMLEMGCPTWDGDLKTLADLSDIAVGVGQISTAMIEFWVAGCICIQVQTSSPNILNQYAMPKNSFSIIYGKNALRGADVLLKTVKEIISNGASRSICME